MTFRPERLAEIAAERGLGLGHPVVFRTLTGSTNDDALEGARGGAPHGAVYVAGTQTAGRGRRGNRWFGKAGQSLAFTILLRPNLAPSRTSSLALVAGLAVRAAVASWLRTAVRNESVAIKWPNDVVVLSASVGPGPHRTTELRPHRSGETDRKLCGILAESQIRGSEVTAVALGIGLNLGTDGLPEELAETATSLSALGVLPDADRSEEAFVADILGELEPRIEAFLAGGESTVEELRLHDVLYGRRVKVGEVEGTALGINRSGSLLIRSANGAEKEVISGHVETT
jgi:BirA family biotin operon repressor/biotin-[acetyl-CoA-carboxylase] ligase